MSTKNESERESAPPYCAAGCGAMIPKEGDVCQACRMAKGHLASSVLATKAWTVHLGEEMYGVYSTRHNAYAAACQVLEERMLEHGEEVCCQCPGNTRHTIQSSADIERCFRIARGKAYVRYGAFEGAMMTVKRWRVDEKECF